MQLTKYECISNIKRVHHISDEPFLQQKLKQIIIIKDLSLLNIQQFVLRW